MTGPPLRGLADTSLFIAREDGRGLDASRLPGQLAVSVVTLGELRAGVLATGDGLVRARRLRTLSAAMELDPVPVDDTVAAAWAELRVALRGAGHRMGVNDSWIAATAVALQVPVVTQDAGFVEVGDLRVVQV